MKIAIYPGTFDPITNGHIDVVERATVLFDKVIIAVAQNPSKKPLFSVSERKKMIFAATSKHKNVEIDSFTGLVVDYVLSKNATAIIRGLRAISDFEYELQMALMNRKLKEQVITVFLMPHEKYVYLNSSIVREVASFGGDVSHLVPPIVQEALQRVFQNRT